MNKNKNILIVEDEKDIRDLLIFNLQKHNYIIDSTHNGEKALSLIRAKKYDLILLDIMIPGINGFDLTRILKNDDTISMIPIIMLTAKGEDEDIIKGLTIGAHDYVTKPFSISVLLARIDNVFKTRTNRKESKLDSIIYNRLRIDLKTRDVYVDDKSIELTYTEFEILKLLSSHEKCVYSREEIINYIKGSDYIVTDRTIDFQIVGLRKKLGPLGKYIKTVRGVGYRFIDGES
ncbi:MAG: DNA-binding response regulator [Candidatus Marinimicrobia bacterium]|nr:DNA-binding response regulator [Candidatus Neomarinimicrobiota bacterium]|tara:strand:- start:72 stop:770 length:699 start_codon:yes stop_codon:yes gene_type:complete